MVKKINDLREKILSSPWIVALLILPFFKPYYFFHSYAVLDWSMVAWKGVSMLVIAVCFLAKPKLSLVSVLLGAYQVVMVLCALYNHHEFSVSHWVYSSASIAALCVLVEEAVDADPKALVKGLFYCLGMLCLVNLATVLLFPNGMDYMEDSKHYSGSTDFYFLGIDNNHGFFIVPLLAAAMLAAWNMRWPLPAQLGLLALFTVSVYITWSATSVVAVSMFLILFVLCRVKKSYRLCNVCTYYGMIAAIFIFIIVLQAIDWLAPLVTDVLRKNMDFSGRIPLWQTAISCIREKPLLGHGIYTTEAMRELSQQINWHNMFLDVLFRTGAVGMAVYLAVFGLLVRPLMRTRKSFCGYMLAAALFAYLLILQAEGLLWPLPFYTLLLLCYHAEKVVPAMEPAPREES